MKFKRFFSLALGIVLLGINSVCAASEISDYALEHILEFVTESCRLKSALSDQEALEQINKLKTEVLSQLKENAVDYEQEKLILENLYFMESYEHLIKDDNRGELRRGMKNQMKRNLSMLESRSNSQLSKWFYVTCAEVTTYYMSRSIAATFYYGFKVKGWHKAALEKDNLLTMANVCLANWNFYAPAPMGSNKKAREMYLNAIKGACTPGEKYTACLYYSQFCFEQKKMDLCSEYLNKAYEMGLGTKELDLISRCNKEGISYLQYLRNRSGIDESIPENEREEED